MHDQVNSRCYWRLTVRHNRRIMRVVISLLGIVSHDFENDPSSPHQVKNLNRERTMSELEPITYKFEVQVLILRENESWIAQGLDYDITGHGRTLDDVLENFERTFVGQILLDMHHGHTPLGHVKKAPKFYWDRFSEAKRLAEKKQFALSLNFPPHVIINSEAAIYA